MSMLPGMHASLLMSSHGHGRQFIYAGSNQNIANVYSGTNTLLTSSDGLSWTSRTPPWTGPVSGKIVYAAGKYLMMGTTSTGLALATSPDAATWTSRTPPWVGAPSASQSRNPQQSAASFYGWAGGCDYGNSNFIICGYDVQGSQSYPRVGLSPDGINWSIGSGFPALGVGQIFDVCFAQGLFVCLAISGNATVPLSSPDGINWTTGNGFSWGSGSSNARIAYGNGVWVAVGTPGGRSFASISSDGNNWTQVNLPSQTYWGYLTHAKFFNGAFYVIGSTYVGGVATDGIIAVSPDGVNWSLTNYIVLHEGNPPGQVDAVNGLAYGQGLYVMGGSTSINIPGYPVISEGTDGVNFTQEIGTPLPSTGISFLLDYA